MNSELVYLKPNVVSEPLFDRWYAWSNLISPATAAMNILDRHLKIMDSYILAPEVHQEVVSNPDMIGAPFMDYKTDRVEDIKKLRADTIKKQARKIEFAKGVKYLNQMLATEGKGYTLEPMYKKVPEILKGYVELVYDINNHASVRFFESLLYKSEFFDKSNQSLVLYLINQDERPFVLSTPRIDDEGTLHLPIPFDHPGIDELFEMHYKPKPYSFIKEILNINEEQEKLFKSLFTSKGPAAYDKYTGDGIRTRYFGHACVLVETKELSILSDPVISYDYDTELSRYTYKDLPEVIDYIIITHNHQDHILLETMFQLRNRTKCVLIPKTLGGGIQDPNLKLMFRNIGFKNVIEIEELESLELPGCTITGVPFIGEHGDLDCRTKMCHLVKTNNMSLLFAADSCNVEPKLYEHVQKITGDIDVLFLGMECDGAPLSYLYGPYFSKELPRDADYGRLLRGSDYEESMAMINCFNPKDVFIYAMGQEPWIKHIMAKEYTDTCKAITHSNRVINECREKGINAVRLFREKEVVYSYELKA
jgi:L-ascorbate metabolism protein UlaG (beta-lactamase superfamily)